jgi:isopenicillin N synthase-like dioxygenase
VQLDIISFNDLHNTDDSPSISTLKHALLQKGIIGIRDVPAFEEKSRAYINAARKFSAFSHAVKQQYSPNRDTGKTEGYEIGAERFKNKEGIWQTDDKKASFYAYVPDCTRNTWPKEIDLKTPYLELGELIFNTGKLILDIIGLNINAGLNLNKLVGYGRMLHYHKENNLTNENPNWCGAHLDHGVFTGLIPAYYYHDEIETLEPEEAGLFIVPTHSNQFEKIHSTNKDILYFQVGEFGQLISNDQIKATRHLVRKANGAIERFTFALFYSADDSTIIQSTSVLTQDDRYKLNQSPDGQISYEKWQKASFERYRAITE